MKKIGIVIISCTIVILLLVGCKDDVELGVVYNADTSSSVTNEETTHEDMVEETKDSEVNIQSPKYRFYDQSYLSCFEGMSDTAIVVTENDKIAFVFDIGAGDSERNNEAPIDVSLDISYYSWYNYGSSSLYIIYKDDNTYKQIDITGIDPIDSYKWSYDNSKIAFDLGNKILVYDVLKDKYNVITPLNNGGLPEDSYREVLFTDYGWSMDSSKIFLETNYIAQTVYYVDTYETYNLIHSNDEFLIKDKIGQNLYVATWYNQERYFKTVIIDGQKNILKVFEKGSYKDYYNESIVTVGDHGFGLYFYPNTNKNGEYILLSADYVHQVSFLAEGYILAILEHKGERVLYLYNSGNEEKFTISDGNFMTFGKKDKVLFSPYNSIYSMEFGSGNWVFKESDMQERFGQSLELPEKLDDLLSVIIEMTNSYFAYIHDGRNTIENMYDLIHDGEVQKRFDSLKSLIDLFRIDKEQKYIVNYMGFVNKGNNTFSSKSIYSGIEAINEVKGYLIYSITLSNGNTIEKRKGIEFYYLDGKWYLR